MLSDNGRKVLRILWSLNQHYTKPLDYLELLRMSQRDLEAIMEALAELRESGCIEWDQDAGAARVIHAYEPDPIDWWLKYR